MIGMPLLTGFVSKYMFAAAASSVDPTKMITAWVALAISTTLNAVYFVRMVLVIYTAVPEAQRTAQDYAPSRVEDGATVGLILMNLALGVASPPVIAILTKGFALLG